MKNRMREICTSGSVRAWGERSLLATRKRVRVGLANARAKGKHIGRAKKRDSDLIRKLLNAGVTYRRIATIAKCSHGAVHAEKVAIRREEEAEKQKKMIEGQQKNQEVEQAIKESGADPIEQEEEQMSLYF